MKTMLEYGEKDSTLKSVLTLFGIALMSLIFFFQWHVWALLDEASTSFTTSWLPMPVVALWRVFCLLIGGSAIIYMLRMKTGTMVVIDYETREEKTLQPIGLQKFVTFSSWNLLCNFTYFLIATLLASSVVFEFSLPTWLHIFQVLFFATALGSAFLTSTIVRYVILPGELRQGRNHDHQFLFHNQMMHNFATMFLAVEIILIQPELHPSFALFGLLIGLLYALFAYPFATFGGGYYVYGFIDPRLRYAPFLLSGLAGAISVFYLGVWLVTQLMSLSTLLSSLVLIVWVCLILQFRAGEFEG